MRIESFMRNAVIRGTGAYLPQRVLPNTYFNDLLGTDVDTWLRENLEIYERRWCEEEESTVDMAVAAAKQALDRAGISPKDLDLIIVATDTPEYLTPSTAAVVQYRLGAGHAGTFDLNSACAGFVTSMDVGAKYIRTDDRYDYVLVIGAYAMSKFLDTTDKKTVTLFADGAGAVVLGVEKDTDRGFLASELVTLGQYHDGMGIYAGGAKRPLDQAVLEDKSQFLTINYRMPPELNVQIWSLMCRNLFQRLEIKPEDVELFIFTQININSIRKTLDGLKTPREKAHTVMHRYGYTGSACIPIAFNDAWEKGKIEQGQVCIMVGSGSGLTFGSVAYRF